jgi:hypothetical protein
MVNTLPPHKETSPNDLSLYLEIPLGTGAGAEPKTSIYFPAGFPPNSQLHVVLYLHGHDAPTPIDRYWKDRRFLLREKLNASEKWVILVAPTLGPKSQAGDLIDQGLDWYFSQVLAGIVQHAPEKVANSKDPSIGSIYLACHSGGGEPMRKLAWMAPGSTGLASNIRECWGFDCLYHPVTNPTVKQNPTTNLDDTEENWLRWAQTAGGIKLFIHWLTYGPGIRAQNLARFAKQKNISNIIVKKSSAPDHYSVPASHLTERIDGIR